MAHDKQPSLNQGREPVGRCAVGQVECELQISASDRPARQSVPVAEPVDDYGGSRLEVSVTPPTDLLARCVEGAAVRLGDLRAEGFRTLGDGGPVLTAGGPVRGPAGPAGLFVP